MVRTQMAQKQTPNKKTTAISTHKNNQRLIRIAQQYHSTKQPNNRKPSNHQPQKGSTKPIHIPTQENYQ